MPSGRITAYIDCGNTFPTLKTPLAPSLTNPVSPFSYFALVHLEKNRPILESHNVEIEYVRAHVRAPRPAREHPPVTATRIPATRIPFGPKAVQLIMS